MYRRCVVYPAVILRRRPAPRSGRGSWLDSWLCSWLRSLPRKRPEVARLVSVRQRGPRGAGSRAGRKKSLRPKKEKRRCTRFALRRTVQSEMSHIRSGRLRRARRAGIGVYLRQVSRSSTDETASRAALHCSKPDARRRAVRSSKKTAFATLFFGISPMLLLSISANCCISFKVDVEDTGSVASV